MHRPPPTSAVALATLLLIGLFTSPTSAGTPGALGEARALLEKGQASKAVAYLEDALSATPSDTKGAILDLLRQAYATAATEAEARGRSGEAELYRDNLQILNRKHPASPSSQGAVPLTETPSASAADESLPPKRDPSPPRSIPMPPPAPTPSTAAATAPAAPVVAPAAGPAPVPVDITAADAAFRAARYDDAGRLYAMLEREGRLPASRRDHWAYCRWAAVVRQINARPSTPQEWAQIDAEIQRIRALSPNNWYGEYLRNRAAERPASGRPGKAKGIVFRGSAPEEPRRAVVPSLKPPLPNATPAPGPGNPGDAGNMPRTAPAGPVQWQVRETASFRILHVDPELAERAAEAAEAARDVQIRRWTGSAPKGPWGPKCELYLYPTALIFSQMTGQPEESPGFSTMGMNAGKIIARRVNLRVDHPNLLRAILPHEITHVVLADLFPHQQIPRWADEGMAVLSEPASEQHLRAADLNEPLTGGRLYKLDQLMSMDYPEGRYWGLYYAQCVSLTRFLVEQGSPTQFVQFVQGTQQSNSESELRRIYNINGFADLQTRWTAYAKSRSAETTAAAPRPDQGSVSTSR